MTEGKTEGTSEGMTEGMNEVKPERALIESAEILTVGTELLMGQILNTNAKFFAEELSRLGISSFYQTTCGDNPERLKGALRTALGRSDCVIVSGGLGPTEDDISMACAAEVAGLPLRFNAEEAAKIEAYFERIGRRATASNLKQAYLPAGARVLSNDNGTAPGCILRFAFEDRERHIVLLPGPPDENRPMFRDAVRAYLSAAARWRIKNIFVRLIGIGESSAEARVRDLLDAGPGLSLAPYASTGEVMFRISERYLPEERPVGAERLLAAFRERLGEYIYEVGQRKMPQVLAELLADRGLTLALAESCTAGLLSDALGAIAGASRFFLGSVVSYSNAAKLELLDVSRATLARAGAVSRACVEEMALGCRRRFGSDFSCAVSGLAGPDGGSEEKPVGTVYIAVAGPGGLRSEPFRFNGSRRKIQQQACLNALNLLRLEVLRLGAD